MRARTKSEAGFTLMEALVSLVMLGVLMGILADSVINGYGAMGQSQATLDCQSTTQYILNYMLVDLREACGTCTGDAANGWQFSFDRTTAPSPKPNPPGNGYIRFTPASGYSTTTGRRTWGNAVEYWFEYDSTKTGFAPADVNYLGQNLNGNGLINPGRIVRRVSDSLGNVIEQSTIATNVLEGFSITAPAAQNGMIPANTFVVVTVAAAKQLEDRTVYATQVTDQIFLRE